MNVNHGITDTGKLKTIEIDKYEPIPDKPGRCRAVGQASKQEIFDQLKDHLEYVGMLPDEYFIISTQQPEIIPENWRDFTCNVSYGGSEGIYLDISLNTAMRKLLNTSAVRSAANMTADFLFSVTLNSLKCLPMQLSAWRKA